jgi:hypothetical protein
VASVGITTIGWLIVTLITPPTSEETLKAFYKRIKPGGPGWKRIRRQLSTEDGAGASALPYQILAMLIGCIMVYSLLFSTGNFLYQNTTEASILLFIAAMSAILLWRLWKRINAGS